jgi:hypothetical protein
MLYVGLLLGLHVPDWEFQVQGTNTNLKTNGTVLVCSLALILNNLFLLHNVLVVLWLLFAMVVYFRYSFCLFQVQCGVRGSLDPPCNAVGLVDRVVLGQNHLYMHPVYRRTKVLVVLFFTNKEVIICFQTCCSLNISFHSIL